MTRHARSATIAGAWPGAERFVSAPQPPQQGIQTTNQPGSSVADQQGRAAGLLRRLSLGAALRVSRIVSANLHFQHIDRLSGEIRARTTMGMFRHRCRATLQSLWFPPFFIS